MSSYTSGIGTPDNTPGKPRATPRAAPRASPGAGPGLAPEPDPEAVWVFDPDFGDTVVCSIEYALGAGWVEITQEEHKKL